MKKLLIDIYYVWKEELKVVFRDPAVILFFFIVKILINSVTYNFFLLFWVLFMTYLSNQYASIVIHW